MMKIYLCIFTLLLYYSPLFAFQIPLYVNKETGQVSSYSGNVGYTSDCCESRTATLTKNGPIIVNHNPSLSMGPGSSVQAGITVDYTFS